MINVAVIGYGYWGPNLLRNFADCPRASVVAASDFRQHRLEAASRRYPAIFTDTDPKKIINDPGVDAVAIAVDDPDSAVQVGNNIHRHSGIAACIDT